MIVYDMATKVLDTELFPQHSIAGLISGITFIVLFSQEKPLRWKEINTHICTNVCYFSDHMPKEFEQKKPHKTMDQCIYMVVWIQVKPSLFNVKQRNKHLMKSVRILRFSGPYFPSFGLNTLHAVKFIARPLTQMDTYSGECYTSIWSFKPLIIFAEKSISDVW